MWYDTFFNGFPFVRSAWKTAFGSHKSTWKLFKVCLRVIFLILIPKKTLLARWASDGQNPLALGYQTQLSLHAVMGFYQETVVLLAVMQP